MNIAFITYKYPGKHNSADYAFVKQLVDAVAALGHHCYVLCPFNITHYRCLSPSKEEYVADEGKVTVLRPNYISLSTFHIGKFQLSEWIHKRALKRAFKMMGCKPDVVYGHFWKYAFYGYEYAKSNCIPLFVATGESEISKASIPPIEVNAFRDYVSGVICVSSKNMDESIELGYTTADKCQVFPNSINANLFKKMDKKQCREQLGFPQDAFIISFVGWFIERKGPLRVSNAIKQIQGEPVYSIFIGRGEKGNEEQIPDCNNILFKGALPHDQISQYLNSSDVFVLPTLHEGCCNAVVEAMACGLPIISSNRSFNWDVLDDKNAIMVDPNNVNEIADSIRLLRDNKELREKMATSSLAKAQSLTIDQRAMSIVEFVVSKIELNNNNE